MPHPIILNDRRHHGFAHIRGHFGVLNQVTEDAVIVHVCEASHVLVFIALALKATVRAVLPVLTSNCTCTYEAKERQLLNTESQCSTVL